MLRNLFIRSNRSVGTNKILTKSMNLFKIRVGFASKKKSKFNVNFEHTAYPCKKIKDDLLELSETLNNNINIIKKHMPNSGINMTTFYLESFASIKYADPNIFDPLYENLDVLIPKLSNTEILMSILESFDKIRCSPEFYSPVPESLLSKLCIQIKKLENILSTTFLLRTHQLLKEFEPENKAVSDLLKTLPKQSCNDLTKIINTLELSEIYEKAKKHVEILEINMDESSYLLKHDSKLLKVFGCLPQPSESINNIKNYFAMNHKKVNTLLLEDMAIFFDQDSKNNMPEPKILYKFSGPEQIENYVKVFSHSTDIFEYDSEKNIILNKINPHDSLPSEIGTSALSFFSNLNPKLDSKIILIDFSIQEIIGSLLKIKSKEDCVKLVDLYNTCTLLEKIKYCATANKQGCHICNKEVHLTIPRDFISIIGGDPEYPLDERSAFYGLHLFDNLINDDDFIHGVAMLGSYHLRDSLKNLLELINRHSVKRIPRLDRNSLIKLQMLQREFANSDKDLMEKLAILESIHHTIESSYFRKEELEDDTDLTKYAEFLEKYGKEISYEKLSENNKEIIISPGDCGADRLIFGDTEGIEDTENDEAELSQTIKFIKEKREEEDKDSFEKKRFKLKKNNDDE